MLWLYPLFLARQVCRQGPNGRRSGCADGIGAQCAGHDDFGLELFERQLQLRDLLGQLLPGGAELHPPETRELHTQRVDEDISRGNIGACRRQCGLELGDASVFVRGGKACVRHCDYIADREPSGQENRLKSRLLACQRRHESAFRA